MMVNERKNPGKSNKVPYVLVPRVYFKGTGLWAYANQLTLDFSRPGKPIDNVFTGAFNAAQSGILAFFKIWFIINSKRGNFLLPESPIRFTIGVQQNLTKDPTGKSFP